MSEKVCNRCDGQMILQPGEELSCIKCGNRIYLTWRTYEIEKETTIEESS